MRTRTAWSPGVLSLKSTLMTPLRRAVCPTYSTGTRPVASALMVKQCVKHRTGVFSTFRESAEIAACDAAEQFPEICAAEAEFLREVLQSDVTRDQYIPDGCNSCQYSIAPKRGQEES